MRYNGVASYKLSQRYLQNPGLLILMEVPFHDVNNKPCLILGEEETVEVLASTLTKYIVFNAAFHLVFRA